MKLSIEWSLKAHWTVFLMGGLMYFVFPWWAPTLFLAAYLFVAFDYEYVLLDEDGKELMRSRTKAMIDAYKKAQRKEREG